MHSFFVRLRALLALCFLTLTVAPDLNAQPGNQPTATFSLPPDLKSKRIHYFAWSTAERHVVLYLNPQSGRGKRETEVQITLLDTTLRVRRQHTITLPGLCEVLPNSPVGAARHIMYQFRQRLRNGRDSTLSLVLDTAGNEIARSQTPYHRLSILQVRSLTQLTDNFFIRRQGQSRKSFFIQSLTPDLKLRWEREIKSPKGRAGLSDYAADSSYLWLVVTENQSSRRNAAVAICLDLATGRELSRTPLLLPGTKGVREPSACNMDPTRHDGAFVVVGQAFRGRRPKGSRMGDLFITQLLPNGTRLADHQLLQPRDKTHWSHVLLQPNGGARILGETYTSTSFGANFAIGLLFRFATLGMFSINQTTLRPREVVVATLDKSLVVQQWQHTELPDGGSIMLPGHVPARRIAQLAMLDGTFRLRMYTDDNSGLLLRTRDRVAYLNLADMQVTTLREQPDHCQQEAMACYGKQVVVLEFDDSSNTFFLHRLPY